MRSRLAASPPGLAVLLGLPLLAPALFTLPWVVLVWLGTASAAAALERDQVAVSEDTLRFGRVLTGTVLERELTIRNEGASPRRLTRIHLTPPLVVTSMPASIPSGTEARIKVRLDTTGLHGRFVGAVDLVLGDDASATVNVRVEATVVPLIEVTPAPAFFLAARRGETRHASVEIVIHESEPLIIERVNHPQGGFSTRLEVLEAGRRYRLTLTLNPDGPAGRHSAPIVIGTSSRSTPTITVVANTYLRERVYTFPDEVDFGTLSLRSLERDPGLLQATMQTLMVYQFGGTGFVARAETSTPQLSVSAERGPQGDRYQYTIGLVSEGLEPGVLRVSITINTNDAEFPTLVIPVTVTIVP